MWIILIILNSILKSQSIKYATIGVRQMTIRQSLKIKLNFLSFIVYNLSKIVFFIYVAATSKMKGEKDNDIWRKNY